MIMSKPEDNLISSFSDNLGIISRVANELYKEGLDPEILEQFVVPGAEADEINDNLIKSFKTEKKQPQFSIPSYNSLTHEKTNDKINPVYQDSSSYYFLPDFEPSFEKQMGNFYYRPELDVYTIRRDFPILQRRVNGKQLIWLDNAATTQKPMCVMNELNRYYSEYNSNIHRGAHTLAKLATNAYEGAREKVRDFIGAKSQEEIIFVRGTTEAINLVAESYGVTNLHTGDEIILTMMEHHSNIVPWQKLQQEKGAVIKVIPINDRGEVILEEYEKLLSPRTRIVALNHVSNVLGTVNPVEIMTEMAHKHGACVLIDGAQAVPHLGVDVSKLDADFYVFSGHKLYGPTGIGVLYGKRAILEQMPPWQRGGGMIKDVNFNNTTYNSLPYKFEAGTGNIADAVGLGAAIDYVKKIGMSNIERHEKELTLYAMEKLSGIPGMHIIGTAPDKTSVISFVIDGIAPENAAQYLNQDGIAVRSGHHCAQPALRRYGLTSSVRASLGLYNTREEVDSLMASLLKITRLYY